MDFTQRFANLTLIAASFHAHQSRKGSAKYEDKIGMPYIYHPLDVVRRVQGWGLTTNTADNHNLWMALLFHDVLEDTSVNFQTIVYHIGREAADIVDELTCSPGCDKVQYMKSFADKSSLALVGKIADRLCNVHDFLIDDPKYAIKYFHKADVVFESFRLRSYEIKDRFGDEVYFNINKDIEYISGL